MKRQKITMVDPWQITARGWKAFKTPKAVENFANKWHVHHVYWRTPGNKRVLLVDFNHFKECYQEYRKTTTKPTTRTGYTTKQTFKSTATKSTSPRSKRTTSSTTYKAGTRPTTKTRTASHRPKTRYSARTTTRRTWR